MEDQVIQDMQAQINRLKSELDNLSANFFKNNFTSHQDFNKSCSFNTKLKVPSYSVLPTCEVGDLAESSGTLYVCSATDTWTVVGTQS
jgi:hypothetical protein